MVLKDRLDHLRGIVKTEKKVKVTELSQRFDVTEETIRRDLERLELEGLITRTHGGAVLKVENMFDRLGYTHRSRTNVEEKKKDCADCGIHHPHAGNAFCRCQLHCDGGTYPDGGPG